MTEIDIRYAGGKIYKIVDNETNEVYFGSTIEKTVALRIGKHRSGFKMWKNGKYGYCKSFDILERNNYSYYLVELFPCNSKDELHRREGYYILNFPNINKLIAGRTYTEWYQTNSVKLAEQHKQYHQDNKVQILEQHKKYYQDNKVQIAEKAKEYYQDNKVQKMEYKKEYYQANIVKILEKVKEYRQDNKVKIAEQKKQYQQDNKVQIAEKGKETITCICGSICRKWDKNRHENSIKHKTFISLQETV